MVYLIIFLILAAFAAGYLVRRNNPADPKAPLQLPPAGQKDGSDKPEKQPKK